MSQTKPGWREALAQTSARIEAIMSSPEAKGREALAEHLAFETNQAAESAVALLRAAPEGRGSRATWAKAIAKANGRRGGQARDVASASNGAWAKAIARANARLK